MIEKKYYEDGKEIFSIEPNPAHPDYEEIKKKQSPLKYTKVQPGEQIKPKEQSVE
jgi:hypothetical protein